MTNQRSVSIEKNIHEISNGLIFFSKKRIKENRMRRFVNFAPSSRRIIRFFS
jgi:hypothetical protein